MVFEFYWHVSLGSGIIRGLEDFSTLFENKYCIFELNYLTNYLIQEEKN